MNRQYILAGSTVGLPGAEDVVFREVAPREPGHVLFDGHNPARLIVRIVADERAAEPKRNKLYCFLVEASWYDQ